MDYYIPQLDQKIQCREWANSICNKHFSTSFSKDGKTYILSLELDDDLKPIMKVEERVGKTLVNEYVRDRDLEFYENGLSRSAFLSYILEFTNFIKGYETTVFKTKEELNKIDKNENIDIIDVDDIITKETIRLPSIMTARFSSNGKKTTAIMTRDISRNKMIIFRNDGEDKSVYYNAISGFFDKSTFMSGIRKYIQDQSM